MPELPPSLAAHPVADLRRIANALSERPILTLPELTLATGLEAAAARAILKDLTAAAFVRTQLVSSGSCSARKDPPAFFYSATPAGTVFFATLDAPAAD